MYVCIYIYIYIKLRGRPPIWRGWACTYSCACGTLFFASLFLWTWGERQCFPGGTLCLLRGENAHALSLVVSSLALFWRPSLFSGPLRSFIIFYEFCLRRVILRALFERWAVLLQPPASLSMFLLRLGHICWALGARSASFSQRGELSMNSYGEIIKKQETKNKKQESRSRNPES